MSRGEGNDKRIRPRHRVYWLRRRCSETRDVLHASPITASIVLAFAGPVGRGDLHNYDCEVPGTITALELCSQMPQNPLRSKGSNMQLATRRAHPLVPAVYSAHPASLQREAVQALSWTRGPCPATLRHSPFRMATPYLFTYYQQITMLRRLCGRVPQFSPGTFVRFSRPRTSIRLARLSITIRHTLHSCNLPLHQLSPFLFRLLVQLLPEHHRWPGLYRPRVPPPFMQRLGPYFFTGPSVRRLTLSHTCFARLYHRVN